MLQERIITNATIIYSKDTEKITLFHHDHCCPEHIVVLDENMQVIENMTHQWDDGSQYRYDADWGSSLPVKIHDTPIFLLYGTSYQRNFHHFLSETFSKFPFIPSDYLIGIPKETYNKFFENLLNTYGLIDRIILLESEVQHKFPHIKCMQGHVRLFDCHPCVLQSFHTLRNRLQISPSKCNRLIYLKRDSQPSVEWNNEQSSATRCIINDEAFEAMLVAKGFEIFTMADKTLQEKRDLLRDSYIVITQAGSNVMNMLFSNIPVHLIIVCNDAPGVDFGYYHNILQQVKGESINLKVFLSSCEGELQNIYSPHYVDVDQIGDYITQCLIGFQQNT